MTAPEEHQSPGLNSQPVLVDPEHSSSLGQLLQELVHTATAAVKDGQLDCALQCPPALDLQVLVGGLLDILQGELDSVNQSEGPVKSSML